MIEKHSWGFQGGLDLVRDALSRNRVPGALIECMNYESREEGYRRIAGYERFDGRKSPSDTLDDPPLRPDAQPGKEYEEIEKRRDLVTPVPGTGKVIPWRYQDRTYAFRLTDEVMKMHGSTKTAGWEEIELGFRVAFTAGTGDAPVNGEALANADSVAGEVIGHYLTGGGWATDDAAGVVVLKYDGDTRFAASDVLTVDADSSRTLTISAIPTEQSISDGELWSFVNYNFFGRGDLERMYGVTGNGNPFEFDGTMFLELETKVDTGTPNEITAFEKHLIIAYKEGSIIYSGIQKPRSYETVDGAGEIAIGGEITGLLAGYRSTLFIYGRNRTVFVRGTSAADWTITTLSEEAGAMANTTV